MGNSADNEWTMGDLEDYQKGKYKRRQRALTLRVILVLFIAGGLLLLAAHGSASDFVQSLLLNLATEAFGAIVIFVIITLYWERRYNRLRSEEEELRKLEVELQAAVQEMRSALSEAMIAPIRSAKSELMQKLDLEQSDFERPEIQDMPFPEAIEYLKNLKKPNLSESQEDDERPDSE